MKTRQYNNGDTCTISANPGSHYTFDGWYENNTLVSSDNPYSFTVSSDKTLEGKFTAKSYTITTATSPVSGGSISGGGTYDYGDTCTLTATENPDYTFATWVDENNNFLSNSNPYTFTVSGDLTAKALFSTNYNTYTITVISPHGTISGDGTYTIGDTVNLSCTPDAGYTFDGWYMNGSLVSSDNPWTFTASGDWTIECRYEALQTYTITVNIDGNGSVGKSNPGPYYYGDSLTLTANDGEHYGFSRWTWRESGEIINNPSNPYTFTITEDRTITCVFSPDHHLYVKTNDTSSIQMYSSNGGWYTLNLDSGDNYYWGDLQDYALNEISGLKKGSSNADNILEIYALNLTGLYSIVQAGFRDCINLKRVYLPTSIIYDQAFMGCSSLVICSALSNTALKTIGNNAFRDCTSLASIYIGSALNYLTYIGNNAFLNCTRFASITCLNTTPPTIGSGAFDNTNNCPIYVPAASLSSYQSAWSEYASRIVAIP